MARKQGVAQAGGDLQEKGHGARYAVRYLVPPPAADVAAAPKPEDGRTKAEKRAQALWELQLKQLAELRGDDTTEEHTALCPRPPGAVKRP